MSLKALIIALVLGVLAWPSAGHAEKATTNQPTKIFSRAGEQAPVILKVNAGQPMTVIAVDGRWIKVRVSGRTGWVPRSKVDLPKEEDVLGRTTRGRPFVDGRGTKRGFDGERGPDDRIGADAVGEGAEPDKGGDTTAAADPKQGDKPSKPGEGDKTTAKITKPAPGGKPPVETKPATGESEPAGEDPGDDAHAATRPTGHVTKTTIVYNAPNPKSDTVFTAQPKTVLFVGEQNGKWTFVENDEGDPGYVLTSDLKVERAASEPTVERNEVATDGTRRRMMDVRAGFGVAFLRQAFKTEGSTVATPPDNYAAQSPSVLAALGASVLTPFGGRGWFGAELAYDYSKALPGAAYNGSTTSFSYQMFDARLALGLDLKRPSGALVTLRGGLHYDAFQVPDVGDFNKNTVRLPNQNIIAPTIGAALVVPRLSPKVSFKATFDAIAFGASVTQTKNLEDGTNPDAKAIFVGLGLGYRIGPKMIVQTTYDLGYTSVSFGGPPPTTSQRNHTGMGTMSVSDFNNLLSISALYGF